MASIARSLPASTTSDKPNAAITDRPSFCPRPRRRVARLARIVSMRIRRLAPDRADAQACGAWMVETAYIQDAFGKNPRIVAGGQHRFVAGALAFAHQPASQPPDQRMKPEQAFHQHVDGGGEIVAPPEVAKFVRQDGVHFLRAEPRLDAIRQHQHWPEDADQARVR